MPDDPSPSSPEALPRPGIVGRAVPFALGAAMLLLAANILRQSPGFIARGTGWRLPGGVWWVVAIACFVYLPRIFKNGFQRQWGAKPQAVALGLVAIAAVWDWAAYRALWVFPMAILLMALSRFLLAYSDVAFLTASSAATPG